MNEIKANYADVIKVLAATEYEGEDTFGGAVCRLAKDLLTRADEAEAIITDTLTLVDRLLGWGDWQGLDDATRQAVQNARQAGEEWLEG